MGCSFIRDRKESQRHLSYYKVREVISETRNCSSYQWNGKKYWGGLDLQSKMAVGVTEKESSAKSSSEKRKIQTAEIFFKVFKNFLGIEMTWKLCDKNS